MRTNSMPLEDLFKLRPDTELQLIERNLRILSRLYGALSVQEIEHCIQQRQTNMLRKLTIYDEVDVLEENQHLRNLQRYAKLLADQERLTKVRTTTLPHQRKH